MADLTGGRAVVELLKAEGVRYIFGIVGSTFLDVLDALYDDRSGRVHQRAPRAGRRLHGRRPRARHRPARRVPGHQRPRRDQSAHRRGRRARRALAGGRPGRRRRARACAARTPSRNTTSSAMFRPVTKLALQVTRPERIPEMLRAALRAAMTGRRGPVLRRDPARRAERAGSQAAPLSAGGAIASPIRRPPHPDAIREAARLLRQAERPAAAGRRRRQLGAAPAIWSCGSASSTRSR